MTDLSAPPSRQAQSGRQQQNHAGNSTHCQSSQTFLCRSTADALALAVCALCPFVFCCGASCRSAAARCCSCPAAGWPVLESLLLQTSHNVAAAVARMVAEHVAAAAAVTCWLQGEAAGEAMIDARHCILPHHYCWTVGAGSWHAAAGVGGSWGGPAGLACACWGGSWGGSCICGSRGGAGESLRCSCIWGENLGTSPGGWCM